MSGTKYMQTSANLQKGASLKLGTKETPTGSRFKIKKNPMYGFLLTMTALFAKVSNLELIICHLDSWFAMDVVVDG